jgi:hypothetical protein
MGLMRNACSWENLKVGEFALKTGIDERIILKWGFKDIRYGDVG